MSVRKVAVLVAGSWGTALASVLAENGIRVALWSWSAEQVEELNRTRKLEKFAFEHAIPEGVTATQSMAEAVEGAEAVIIASPTSAMVDISAQLAAFIKPEQLIVHVAKGFEKKSLHRMSQVIAANIPQYDERRIVVLSGPSHAEEVILHKPTTVVVAAADIEASKQALALFFNEHFRVYLNEDLAGVEIAGALKNIIALAAGMSDGLGLGDNAKAALVTRGLNEIVSLGVKLGGRKETFFGLAGLGDLLVTCGSLHSRNYRAGYMIGEGKQVDEHNKINGMVVEGINTTKAAYLLSREQSVSMPIVEQLYHVLFEGKSPRQAVYDLMTRDARLE